MKRISRYGLMLLAVAAVMTAPSAWAACNVDTQIVGHTLGGTIINCPDANPVEGYIWLLANPATANSNGQNFVCRHEGEPIPDSGVDCTFAPGAGIDGDGIVTVYMEFGVQNSGSAGCPNPAQAGNGTTSMGVQIVCNNGASAMFQMGFSEDFQQFPLELGSPADGSPVSANFNNGLAISSVTAGPSPSASNVCVNVPLPSFNTDCDPDTFGGLLTCPNPAVRPPAERGILMISNGPCNGNPDLRATGGPTIWTAATVQPDAAGNACNVVNPPTGQCAYLGVQGKFGGVNGGGIIGYSQVGGPAASANKVKIDGASTAQGRVKVDFSTTNETSIVGFNVYSDGAKLNGSLISSKGVGNNAYTFEVGRGALKGGKSVIVEAVKNDGTVEKTAPVSLK